MKTNGKQLFMNWLNIKFVISESYKASRLLFLYYGIFSILSAIQPLILILFPKFIIDELTGLQRSQQIIILLISMFVISSLVSFFIAYFQNLKTTQIIKTTFQFSRKNTEKNLTTNYTNTENPDYLNKMESANRSLSSVTNGVQGLLHNLFSLLSSLLGFIIYTVIVASLNPLILLLLIFTAISSYFLSLRAKKYEYSRNDEISECDRRSTYAYQIMYDFAYGKELRIYNMSKNISAMYKLAKEKRLKIQKDIKYKYLLFKIVDVFFSLLRDGISYAYLIYLFLNEKITIGNFTMYFLTIASFAYWVQMIMNNFAQIRTQNLYINDLRTFQKTVDDVEQENVLSIPKPPFSIEFKNVSFKYPNSHNYVFKNFSIMIPPKQRLAIVGHNGAGKTTFVKLLCRLYEPTEGEILINGYDIRDFSKKEYYRLLSAVFQEVKILAFSIAENIALKERELIDLRKVNDCLIKADMSKKISSLTNGINTSMLKFLDEGGIEFSGGENQRIVLARALYKNGGIVILDEPTAALDALAEYHIYNHFEQYFKDRTTIYISHRLASTRFCDKIAFLENGELVEYGTHRDLINLNGKYAEMFKIQAKYYQNLSGEDYEN